MQQHQLVNMWCIDTKFPGCVKQCCPKSYQNCPQLIHMGWLCKCDIIITSLFAVQINCILTNQCCWYCKAWFMYINKQKTKNQFLGTGSRKSVRISFSMYSIGNKAESSSSSEVQTDDECVSVRDTFGADRARDNVCRWGAGGVSWSELWVVEVSTRLLSVTAAFTVTKKLHKSVRVAGRADANRGRLATRGNSGTSPNYNKDINQISTSRQTAYKTLFTIWRKHVKNMISVVQYIWKKRQNHKLIKTE